MSRRLGVVLVAVFFAATFYLILRGIIDRGGLAVDKSSQISGSPSRW